MDHASPDKDERRPGNRRGTRGGSAATQARNERIVWAQGQLGLLKTDKQIIAEGMTKFKASRPTLTRDLVSARARTFKSTERKELQEASGQAWITLYQVSLSREQFVAAARALEGLARMYRLDMAPEELMSEPELKERFVAAMIDQAHRLEPEQRARIARAMGSGSAPQ